MKKCVKCGSMKFEDAFYLKDKKTGRRSTACRDCQKEVAQSYYSRNKDKVKKRVAEYQRANPDVNARSRANRKANGKRRLADLRYNYGITAEEYTHLLVRSGGLCEVCGRDPIEVSKKGLCLDHCHDSGKVRGILCAPCNTALGNLRDDPDVLRKAIEYLETHSAQTVVG